MSRMFEVAHAPLPLRERVLHPWRAHTHCRMHNRTRANMRITVLEDRLDPRWQFRTTLGPGESMLYGIPPGARYVCVTVQYTDEDGGERWLELNRRVEAGELLEMVQ